jgi:hypothetical protein
VDDVKRTVYLPQEEVPPHLWKQWIAKTKTLHEGDDFDKVGRHHRAAQVGPEALSPDA